jgi:transcriptional regulator with XRE-family HTH domain
VTAAPISPFWIELGERLKAARVAAEMTQTQLAERLALTRSSIANAEAGRQRIDGETIVAAAGVLGCDAGWLLTGQEVDGRPQPPRPVVSADALDRVASELDGVSAYLRDVARRAERAVREGGHRD